MRIIPVPPPRRRHDFTLTMINIVFLLLLFFLTTGSLTNREEAQSAIPVTRNLPLERLPRPLLLLQADGALFLDGVPVPENGIADAARRAVEAAGRADDDAQPCSPHPICQRGRSLRWREKLRTSGLAVQIVTLREPPGVAAGSP